MHLWLLHRGPWCGLLLFPSLHFLEQTLIIYHSGWARAARFSKLAKFASPITPHFVRRFGFWVTLPEQGKHFSRLPALRAGELLPPLSFSWSGVKLPSRGSGMSGGTGDLIPCFDAKDKIGDQGHEDEKSGQDGTLFLLLLKSSGCFYSFTVEKLKLEWRTNWLRQQLKVQMSQGHPLRMGRELERSPPPFRQQRPRPASLPSSGVDFPVKLSILHPGDCPFSKVFETGPWFYEHSVCLWKAADAMGAWMETINTIQVSCTDFL